MSKRVSILIVEEESVVAFHIRSRLEEAGYIVAGVVTTGKEAIVAAEALNPDLVLMDIQLPGGVDGIQAATEIRDRCRIPIVYLTAYADPTTLQRAKVTEPYGYILKPFETRELFSAIEIALYRHARARELEERERWLSTTLTSIGDAVITTDRNGIITFMNPVAESLTGWSCQEALGQELSQVFSIIDETTREQIESPVTIALRQGTIVGLQNHTLLVTKDGTEIPIDDSAAPIRTEKETLAGAVLVFHDIIERRRAQLALQQLNQELERRVWERTAEIQQTVRDLETEISGRQQDQASLRYSETRYRNLIETIPHGIKEIDLNGVITFANVSLHRMLGYDEGELIGKSIWELTPASEHSTITEYLAYLRHQQPPPSSFYPTNITKDGRFINVQVDWDYKYNEQEELIGFIAVITNITDRIRAEQERLTATERLNYLLASSPAIVYTCQTHPPYQLSYISENVFNLMGYTPEECLSDSVFLSVHLHPDDRPRILQEFKTLQTQEQISFEFRCQHKDGFYRWLLNEAKLIRDAAGEPLEIVGSIMDISDRHVAEEQLRDSLEEKSVLLQEVHHRVKNNLQTVSSLLRLQAGSIDDSRIKEALQESQNRVLAMALVHEKLYRSPSLSKVNFADYTRRLTSDLLKSFNVAGRIRLHLDLAEVDFSADTIIPCGLILNELVCNALQHAFPDERSGDIQIRFAQMDNAQYILAVQDNGIGLPDVLSFENPRSLGLQLVRSLARQLQGSIELDRNQPTAFVVRFPVRI